jgi:hypothetical protein
MQYYNIKMYAISIAWESISSIKDLLSASGIALGIVVESPQLSEDPDSYMGERIARPDRGMP